MENPSSSGGLAGLRVLSLESRRAAEMAKLIAHYGGQAIVAPSMQEVPLESNSEALDFARTLVQGGFDMVIFLTGVGTRALTRLAETVYSREQWVAALRQVTVVARGPKPVAALTELGVPVSVAAPEPNTWREVLRSAGRTIGFVSFARAADCRSGIWRLKSGVACGTCGAGRFVTRVPIYEWALPDDTGPLRAAVQAVVRGEVDVALFTTSVQVIHLLRIAREMESEEALLRSFARIVVGSIGPVTSEALREHGLPVDFEPEHPRMGFLVNEAALAATAPEANS